MKLAQQDNQQQLQSDITVKKNRIPPPIPPKNIYNKQSSLTPYQQTEKPNEIQPDSSNEPQTDVTIKPTSMDHIKRTKKAKNQRMNEQEARKILLTMVTPGDPLDKYDLKDKLGSGNLILWK